jgi:glycosyltransferase involved in cell wall biosynthesis
VSVLVLTNVLPARRKTGGEILTQNVIDALRSGGRDVEILAYLRPDDPPPAAGEVCVGRRRIETSEAGVRALGWGVRAVAAREPYTTAKWRSRGYTSAVRERMARGPETVVVDHAGLRVVAPPFDSAPFVFIAHNAEAEMYRRLAEQSGGRLGRWVNAREARRIRAVETELARGVDQVWTLTDADSEYFRGLHPGADIRKLEVASAMEPSTAPVEPEYDVAVIGTWNWHANSRGLRWFADEVVPRLPRELSVAVAGRGADWLAGRHPNVDVRGVVPDAQRFMSAARVAAVPSVTGGGIQIKTLDAIACGVPVVVTEVATRGIDDLPATVAVASDPGEFAERVTQAAATADRGEAAAEAATWSNARRSRFEAAVQDWLAELAGPAPVAAQPAAAVERSAARPA